VKSATLVGHSNGAPVIRQFYRRYPQEVRGLVIVEGALRRFGDAAMMENFITPLRGSNYPETADHFIDGITKPMTDPAQ
jgi:pimeloyl-ACP methyl ester carboxylesterase